MSPSVRFPVPSQDGGTERWKISVANGNGVFLCVREDGHRREFHESEIRTRVGAIATTEPDANHIDAKMTLVWWDAQPSQRILHVRLPCEIPGLSGQIFARGTMVLADGRKAFQATQIVAPEKPFREAMADAAFMREVRAALRVPQIPDLRDCYEAEMAAPAYDPRTRDAIPATLLMREAPAERLDRMERAAKKRAALRAGAKTRKGRNAAKAKSTRAQ